MKAFKRLLQYAAPLQLSLPAYLILTLIGITLSLGYIGLIMPLLEVIFDIIPAEEIERLSQEPTFEYSLSYAKDLFYHNMIDFVVRYEKYAALVYVCISIVILVLLSNFARYTAGLIMSKIRIRTIKKIRIELFDKITALDIGYFTDKRKGDLLSRVTNDVSYVEGVTTQALVVLFREPVTIILYFSALFFLSFKLTIFTILVLPISGLMISRITTSLKKHSHRGASSLGHIVNIIDETLGGIRIIKAFNATNYMRKVLKKEVDNYSKIDFNIATRNLLASPMSEFLGVIVVSIILLYGGYLVLSIGEMKPSTFFTYLTFFAQILQPTKTLASQISNLQRGLASAERVFEIIDKEPKIKNVPNAQSLPEFNEQIEFKNVDFAYESELVLKNINLSIKKGQMVALVGPSGGGKSTLADLVPRFYDPLNGEVLIDGENTKTIKVEDIRQHMGIVTQESILFNDTVFNNIAFGKSDASEEEVIQAARVANAYEFIQNLEKGLHTNIGERGMKLSGGQRQRISIARAVLKNPPILILDEATSALDSESERLVQEALFNLMKNRTTLVIAHRLSTIQNADLILVVKDGEIVERGSHEELFDQGGLYSKLTKMQSF